MTGFPGRMAFAKKRTSAPILQSGMIVVTEKFSASEEGSIGRLRGGSPEGGRKGTKVRPEERPPPMHANG